MAPPTVFPAVATTTAGQKRSEFIFTTANTAGSEPMGSSVAESKLIMNSEGKPTEGNDKILKSAAIVEASMSIARKRISKPSRAQGKPAMGVYYDELLNYNDSL